MIEEPENVDETTADEAPAADAEPAGDAPAPTAAEPAAPAEPVAPQTPKERRSARRAAAVAKRGPGPRTPEERAEERKRKARVRAARRPKERAKRRAASSGEATPPREHGEGRRKVRQGIVVSDKADKTIIVRIDIARRHRRYDKVVRTSTTLHAHDERNDAHEGDTVTVIESRPLSRTKRWRLVDVVERAR